MKDFIIAIVGVIIGGIITFITTVWQFNRQIELDIDKKEVEIKLKNLDYTSEAIINNLTVIQDLQQYLGSIEKSDDKEPGVIFKECFEYYCDDNNDLSNSFFNKKMDVEISQKIEQFVKNCQIIKGSKNDKLFSKLINLLNIKNIKSTTSSAENWVDISKEFLNFFNRIYKESINYIQNEIPNEKNILLRSIKEKNKPIQKIAQSKLWNSKMKKERFSDKILNIGWLFCAIFLSLIMILVNINITEQITTDIPKKIVFTIISAIVYCGILVLRYIISMKLKLNFIKYFPNTYIISYYIISFKLQSNTLLEKTKTYDDTIKMFTIFFILVNIIERICKTITDE